MITLLGNYGDGLGEEFTEAGWTFDPLVVDSQVGCKFGYYTHKATGVCKPWWPFAILAGVGVIVASGMGVLGSKRGKRRR